MTDKEFENLIIDTLEFDWGHKYYIEHIKWAGIMSVLKTLKIISCRLNFTKEQYEDISLLFLIATDLALISAADRLSDVKETPAILKQQNA